MSEKNPLAVNTVAHRAMIHLPPGRYRVYLRISQDQSGREVGVERQQYDLMPSIEGNPGVEIVEWYRDPDVSATKENVVRPDFERLIEDLQPGEKVLCWHTDRFIRTTRDLMRILKTGALVHALYAGYFDLSTPAGIAVAKTQIAWAEYEGQQKALRQKSSHQQRAREGRPFMGGARPFGFVKVDGTYMHHPDEARLVPKAFEMLLAGSNTRMIADYLNLAGSTSKGKAWNYSSVRQMLVQPRYAGILTYNGEEIGRGNWEPLIAEETYRAAVRLLNDPTRRTRGPRAGRGGIIHWLVGIAKCGKCGGATRAIKRPNGSYAYGCRKGHASAHAEWLEQKAAALIVSRVREPVSERRADDAPTVDGIRAELERLRRKGEMYSDALDGDSMSMEQFLDLNGKNLAKIKELEKSLTRTRLGSKVADLLDVDDLASHWLTLDPRAKADIADAFFEKILVHPRGKGETGKCPGIVDVWIEGLDEPLTLAA